MTVKNEQVEKNLVKLTFEVSAEDFNKAINDVYRKNVKKFNIPGFRKGKAPRAVIEKYYTEAVFYDDAVNAVLPEAYENAVKEAELDVVAKPEIDIEEIKKGEPVVFTALVTTKPEVTLGDYKGIEVEKIEHNVTDEDVQKDLEAAQKKNARLITVEDRPIENGDIAVIDFEGFVDGVAFDGGKGDDYELEIGSGTFIPGFEEQLVGAKTDDLVDVNVKFPEEYHAENLKGKDAVFKVKVNEIKVRELPELNDDFASEISEFDTLEEYKADVRKKLEAAAENKVKAETEDAIVKKVIENAEFDIPEAMKEAEIDRLINDFAQRIQYQGVDLDMYLKYTNMTMEQLRAQFEQQAKDRLSSSLVLEAIMKKEGIETGPEELELELVDMAKKYNMELDKLKELLSDAETENIKRGLAVQKTVTMLVNNAVVK
ncbi:MAG TPA: trigger factor [Candidatus Ornithomonoglobus intestinigallinarum]|uniref:Trigger factor n=1 Tax=Candidatus Ornithomonoglobus intestinigallinarum TaxID=2840894 RepID=A0A9D1H4Y0_9FIRM|nr:trigger factor [Candidatus Ornithomonoglobus intestinigallinarum]